MRLGSLFRSTAYMLSRRRWLQIMWLATPVVNVLVTALVGGPRLWVVVDLGLALTAIAMMVRTLPLLSLLGGVVSLAAVARSVMLGAWLAHGCAAINILISAGVWILCVRWQRADVLFRALRQNFDREPMFVARVFHGLVPGLVSYRSWLLERGESRSVVGCVEELCEERLSLVELVMLRQLLDSRDSSSSPK